MRLDKLETPAKKTSNLSEGLRESDLVDLVSPVVSIDAFEPKSGKGKDVVVMAFRVSDEEPAQDLSSFIEKGVHELLDTEVSPTVDEDGMYLVFVEIKRDENLMNTVVGVLKDIDKLVNIPTWEFEFHNSVTITISKGDLNDNR